MTNHSFFRAKTIHTQNLSTTHKKTPPPNWYPQTAKLALEKASHYNLQQVLHCHVQCTQWQSAQAMLQHNLCLSHHSAMQEPSMREMKQNNQSSGG